MRWGVGPVFVYECLAASRRWQTYAVRSLGVGALVAAMVVVAGAEGLLLESRSAKEYVRLGESLFYSLVGVELTLVMLAAPAATAGTICLDRARGTLEHMLATDLSDPEIVLGKLAARLLPILGLVACTWPVMSLATLLGGIDPIALTLAFAIILAVGLVGCTLALSLSVWARRPHEVVLVCYSASLLVLLLWPVWTGLSRGRLIPGPPRWTLLANPFYTAFAPYADPGKQTAEEYLGFLGACLGLSAALTGLALWRMRPVARRGRGEPARGRGFLARLRRRLPGPSLDADPVLWREWYGGRSSTWTSWLVFAIGGATSLACAVGAGAAWRRGLDPNGMTAGAVSAGVYGYMIQILFGLLMLSAVAAFSMSEERQRGSLDILASTTLTTRELVVGKWLGTFRLVPLIAAGPTLMALAMATASKAPATVPAGMPPALFAEITPATRIYGALLMPATILAHGALIASLGLALAIWIPRQGRAVAISVATYIFVAVASPVLVTFAMKGPGGRDPAALSPIFVGGLLADLLTIRRASMASVLVWATFWDLVVAGLAAALLWLSVRTFDHCLGRLPEEPRGGPLLADFVAAYCAVASVGYASWAVATPILGVTPRSRYAGMDAWLNLAMLPLVFGLPLIAVVGLVSAEGARGRAAAGADRARGSRTLRGAIRPALLLAIGPALLAYAVATAGPADPPHDGVVAVAAPGGQVHYTLPQGIDELAFHLRLGLPERLATAGLLALTLLAHGAALAGLGMVAGATFRRRRRAMMAVVALFVTVQVVAPVACVLLDVQHGPGLALLSGLVTMNHLAAQLLTREPQLPGLLPWAGFWAAAWGVSAMASRAWAIRRLGREVAGEGVGEPNLRAAAEAT